jgi:hypothetical protein
MYLQPRANTILAKGQAVADITTGEIISEDVLIGRRKIVDKSEFAKIYASEISVLFDLSKKALTLLIYFMKKMDYENKIIFDYKKQYKDVGYKAYVQPLKAIRELIANEIIAPHIVDNIYWINPTIICKGERFAKYTEYVTEDYIKNKQIAEQKIKEQAKESIGFLDDKTQDQINAMNAEEERKYNEENMQKLYK